MEDTFSFTSVLENSNNSLWGFHLPVPVLVARALLAHDAKRVVCTLKEKVNFQCGLIPKGDGSYCIMVNKKLRTQLGLKEGSAVEVHLRKDESEYGLPMPEEMEEALRQDPEGREWFQALPPGKRRTMLYFVGSVKDPDKRIGRSLVILDHLKRNAGQLNYRQLNEELKKAY